MRTCTKCKLEIEVSEFYLIRNRPASICKECTKAYKRKIRALTKHKEYIKAYNKTWREENPEKVKGYSTRKYRLLYDYGITEEQYTELLVKQKHSCAICGVHKDELVKPLYVDHCHSTEAIRGLLCQKCNSGIGLLKDSVEVLEKAIAYLKK